ncbi:MAG: hypothetical protein SF066_11060 [Thermoanaerobaculia bacterium]|nr:hypothetical protein [Thermoanaerobaculia bacterium]
MARTYTVILPVRFTPDEAAELARKASLMRLRRGTFLRQAALAAPFASRIDRELLRRLGQLVVAIDEQPERAAELNEDLRRLLEELL